MKAIVLATIGAASVTASARAVVTIIPVADNRVVHVQGTIVPPGGEPIFDFDALGPSGSKAFDGSVDMLLELPEVSFSGGSTQTSEFFDRQLVASGFSTVELAADAPKALSSGNSCSHFILTFNLIDPASYALTGLVDAVDDTAGTADALVSVRLERLSNGVLVVDDTVNSGALNLDFQGVLAPGTYRIAVESHVTGMVGAEPPATASSTFDVTLTVQERCPDFDGDNVVGITDLFATFGAWGPNPGHPADLDGDGVVGIVDLFELFGHWGPCP